MKFFAPIVMALFAAGCASLNGNEPAVESALARARALEAGGKYNDAAGAYATISELQPRSEETVRAIRKAAILYAHPLNQDRNDSAAIFWFRQLALQPVSVGEQELAELQVAMLERARDLARQGGKQKETIDSLQGTTRRLAATAVLQGKQLQDLEAQVTRVSEELRQLKEIDVRLSKRKQKE